MSYIISSRRRGQLASGRPESYHDPQKLPEHCSITSNKLRLTMSTISWAALALAAYVLGLATYRLYLSPIARSKIPGPKLGALSRFYEAYYEIVKKGKLTFKLDELHDRYGNI